LLRKLQITHESWALNSPDFMAVKWLNGLADEKWANKQAAGIPHYVFTL
jgi:hypothetical protein